MQNSKEVPQKKQLKLDLTHNSAIPFLGTYPEEMKTEFQWGIYTSYMFIITLFTIVKIWKQPKSSSKAKG